MTHLRVVAGAVVLIVATAVYGSPTGTSLGVNFGADEPEGAAEGFVEGAAGVLQTENWNNFEFLDGGPEDLIKDVAGAEMASTATVEWISQNTWSSDGRGNEDLNDAVEGNDRALMLGYLDTNDTSVTEIIVEDIDPEIASGFDVYVYVLGGVLDRGGTYTITAGGDEIALENIQTEIFEGDYIEGDEGNYLLFEGLSGDSLTLEAQATTTALFRAPVNAIEIAGAAVGGDCPLQAGDANMDAKFDPLDLVQVQQRAKYLSGQPATWGDGDWDGAPGGTAPGGPPPVGNGVFDTLDIIAALSGDQYLKGDYCAAAGLAALAGPSPPNGATDEQASIVYNPKTGEVGVNAPASTPLTSVNIDSASGIFVGHENALNLDGSFDTHSENNIFKATFGDSFGDISFGEIAQTGLSEDAVIADLTVIGSLEGGGGLGDVDLIYVPEPSTIMLLGVGLAMALIRRRR